MRQDIFEELKWQWEHTSASNKAAGDWPLEVEDVAWMLTEVERLRAENDGLRIVAREVVRNGSKALRGRTFNCWYCGEQPFKYFEPGGVLEAGWEHDANCTVMVAKRLLDKDGDA